jgi:hypothetical protein
MPVVNDSHFYEIHLDDASCALSAWVDGSFCYEWQDVAWIDTTGSFASWSGEAYHAESDVFGIEQVKCIVTACSTWTLGDCGYEEADIGNHLSKLTARDFNVWRIEYLPQVKDTLHFWDLNPLLWRAYTGVIELLIGDRNAKTSR